MLRRRWTARGIGTNQIPKQKSHSTHKNEHKIERDVLLMPFIFTSF